MATSCTLYAREPISRSRLSRLNLSSSFMAGAVRTESFSSRKRDQKLRRPAFSLASLRFCSSLSRSLLSDAATWSARTCHSCQSSTFSLLTSTGARRVGPSRDVRASRPAHVIHRHGVSRILRCRERVNRIRPKSRAQRATRLPRSAYQSYHTRSALGREKTGTCNACSRISLLLFGVTDGARTHNHWNHNPELCLLSYGHHVGEQTL